LFTISYYYRTGILSVGFLHYYLREFKIRRAANQTNYAVDYVINNTINNKKVTNYVSAKNNAEEFMDSYSDTVYQHTISLRRVQVFCTAIAGNALV
jgi:hypothetical protein